MKFVPTIFPDTWLIELPASTDVRGTFVKTFHEQLYAQSGLKPNFAEEFYSVSHKNVVRGMHFQTPPRAADKLVYCPAGAVLDVVVDLRRGSPMFGRVASFALSAENHCALFIPAGLAHGFLSLADNSMMVYKCSAVYAPANDMGVNWVSIGFEWPVVNPIVSPRDAAFPTLAEYVSPFA